MTAPGALRPDTEGGSAGSLVVRGLDVGYGKLEVVHDVDLEVEPGAITAVVGANGAGKTTLLKGLMGLIPSKGEVLLGGKRLDGQSPTRRVAAGLALVPEGRLLFAGLSVRDNLVLGAAGAGRRQGRAAGLEEVCDLFPALSSRLDSPAGVLSGGQQQMVAIGRALMSEPQVLLLDEPSQGLAPVVWSAVLDALPRIASSGRTVVVVEQRTADVVRLASRTHVMRHGRFVLTSVRGTSAEHDLHTIATAYMGEVGDA